MSQPQQGANKGDDVHHALRGPHMPRVGNHDAAAKHLENLVEKTKTEHNGHVMTSSPGGLSRISGYVKSLACMPSESEMDDTFARWKMGNYVAIRGSDEKIFEEMPLYVRVGMHLLFYRSEKASLLRWNTVENLLRAQSKREGEIYDDTKDKAAVQAFIKHFIDTYKIDTSQLAEPDLEKYQSRNEFFYRKLRPDARPIAEPGNNKVIGSAADCRLMLFDNVESAKRIWIKGHEFSVKELLAGHGTLPESSSLAVFRLAPADYHRYNHPIGPCKALSSNHAGSEYYTVNPDAVNEDFDVFTGNTRDVTMFEWSGANTSAPIKYAFVSIGALLVGANRFTGASVGSEYKRGDEMGYFAYGGSTVIAVFPPELKVKWDADIMSNSQKGLETLIKCNERIGLSEA